MLLTLATDASVRSFLLARRARTLRMSLTPASLTPEEVADRFARATAILIRISDRLEEEAEQQKDESNTQDEAA